LMRWALQSWRRMRLLNRLGGVFAAKIEMDYLPALFSGAVFTIRPSRPFITDTGQTIRLLHAGEAIQRFWLTATALGLALQPNLALICFCNHGIDPKIF